MVSLMRVETDKGVTYLWFAAVIGLAFCFLFLLIGVAGPQSDAYDLQYAYNCFNNTHHGETKCPGGVDLVSGERFTSEVSRMDPLFQYLALQVFPFMRRGAPSPNQTFLTLNVTLYGKNRERLVFLWNRVVVNYVECDQDGVACSGFYLVDEPTLEWPSYVLEAHIPDSSPGASFLGDFLFQWEAANPQFTQEEMGVRITLAIIAIAVLSWYSFRLYQVGQRAWTMEQTWMLMLLSALVWFNNPFYPLSVLSDVPLFPVLFALFEALYQALWILYGLMYLRMILADDNLRGVNWKNPVSWLVCAAVFLYFVLSVSLFVWEQVLFVNDPIVKPATLTGPSILFFVVSITYFLLCAWMGLLVVMIFPRLLRAQRAAAAAPPAPRSSNVTVAPAASSVASAAPVSTNEVPSEAEEARTEEWSESWREVTSTGAAATTVAVAAGETATERPDALRLRLLHSVGPLLLTVVCTLMNIVGGSVGPFGRTAPSFMFFHALHNVVLFYWIAGFWPVGTVGASRSVAPQRGNIGGDGGERLPLVSNPFAASERQADEPGEREPIF